MLTVLVGGARSGKSALAVDLAIRSGLPVITIATATAGDDEMAERIARHRADRPDTWQTVEEPVDLAGAIAAAPPDVCVIVDCLSLWTMNTFTSPEDDVLASVAQQVDAARARTGPTIVVGNEVGSGIVPADASTRAWRDRLGRVNAAWSRAADQAFLVVAGRVLPLGGADTMEP